MTVLIVHPLALAVDELGVVISGSALSSGPPPSAVVAAPPSTSVALPLCSVVRHRLSEVPRLVPVILSTAAHRQSLRSSEWSQCCVVIGRDMVTPVAVGGVVVRDRCLGDDVIKYRRARADDRCVV